MPVFSQMLVGTEPNAFWKSKYIASTVSLLSKCCVWYSRMCSYWEVHDLPGIKPYWWAESKFLLVKDSFYLWMGLTKKVLLPMTGSPTFSQIQSYMNALLDFNVRHNLSASAGYFFLALWRSVQAVWEYSWHHGRPVVSYVCSLVVLNIDLWYWFAIISECF